MKLSEFFSMLTYGELSNLKVGGKDVGGIYPKTSDEVVSYIRQGLTDLHTRFTLKHNEVVVQQYDHITFYPLRYEFAQTNLLSPEPYKWISDSEGKPFQEDILLITEIFDEEGNEVPLNNDFEEDSIYTPQSDVLQITQPVAENAIAVLYKANHNKIDLSVRQPKDITLEIPAQLIRPLALYVSSLAHTAVGSPEGMQTGFTKMQEYEAACLQIEVFGLVRKESWTQNNTWRNGWV